MCNLMTSLVTLDSVVLNQGILHDHMAAYMRLLKSVQYNEQNLCDQIKVRNRQRLIVIIWDHFQYQQP